MAIAYYTRRLLDTFLREDLFGLTSQSQIGCPPGYTGEWLRYDWGKEEGCWWIPVHRCQHLQPWRASQPWVLSECNDGWTRLDSPQPLLAPILCRIDEPAAALEELECALSHHSLAQEEQRRWFPQASLWQWRSWHQSLSDFDRLASFLDHPLYPTARAKVGFDESALRKFSPEWGNEFELHWLAVPEKQLQPFQGKLPAWWPRASDWGFKGCLLPIHPHTLPQLDLPAGCQLLPQTLMRVRPTLSVRTVSLVEHPHYHLKLPLHLRTLSFKNLRKIKADTILDGDLVQTLLSQRLQSRCLLTDESTGASFQQRADLAFILRRYPDLHSRWVLPTAALLAPTPHRGTVLQELVERLYGGEEAGFFKAYIDQQLQLHIPLWVLHGIALESNQQNTLLVLGKKGELSLLLKDNDAARIYESVAQTGLCFADPCLVVEDWLPLAQMFLTITLHLNLQPFIEASQQPQRWWSYLRRRSEQLLDQLPAQQVAASQIRHWLLESPHHWVKYLYSAGTLFSKSRTGAADINKHYGLTGPNGLLHSA